MLDFFLLFGQMVSFYNMTSHSNIKRVAQIALLALFSAVTPKSPPPPHREIAPRQTSHSKQVTPSFTMFTKFIVISISTNYKKRQRGYMTVSPF